MSSLTSISVFIQMKHFDKGFHNPGIKGEKRKKGSLASVVEADGGEVMEPKQAAKCPKRNQNTEFIQIMDESIVTQETSQSTGVETDIWASDW